MSVLDFDGASSNSGMFWNYTNSEKDNFCTRIQGDVVKIKVVQQTDYKTGQPKFFTNKDGSQGRPMEAIQIVLRGRKSGTELAWEFKPGGKGDRASTAMKAIKAGLQAAGHAGASVAELAGKFVDISTVAPPQGFSYSQSNPRPWTVQILGDSQVPFRGVFELGQDEEGAQPSADSMGSVAPAPTQVPANWTPQFTEVPHTEPVPVGLYDQDIPF